MSGQILIRKHESKILKGYPGTPEWRRPVHVYLPEVASGKDSAVVPVIYLLAPWTNAGRSQFEWKPFRESLGDRLDRLIDSGTMKPVAVVAVDLYTPFGGSQYINSDFFGPHSDYIVQELIPFCEKEFPIMKGRAHRAVMGRSSGGFGALRLQLDQPGQFAAAACHSGDLGFQLMFGGDLPTFCQKLARYGGDASKFLEFAYSAPKLNGGDVHLLMLLGMCGFYSADRHEKLGFKLPVDPIDGRVNHDVWQQWLAHDPVAMAQENREALSALKYLYIECGQRDQYHLLYGARQLHGILQKQGIEHRYEEFNDDHSGTEYRYDVSLPELAAAISP